MLVTELTPANFTTNGLTFRSPTYAHTISYSKPSNTGVESSSSLNIVNETSHYYPPLRLPDPYHQKTRIVRKQWVVKTSSFSSSGASIIDRIGKFVSHFPLRYVAVPAILLFALSVLHKEGEAKAKRKRRREEGEREMRSELEERVGEIEREREKEAEESREEKELKKKALGIESAKEWVGTIAEILAIIGYSSGAAAHTLEFANTMSRIIQGRSDLSKEKKKELLRKLFTAAQERAKENEIQKQAYRDVLSLFRGRKNKNTKQLRRAGS